MKPYLFVSLLGGACAAMAVSLAQTPAMSAAQGYLSTSGAPDMLRVLPPPPKPGSKRDAADREVFTRTRSLEGQPRWSLATQDADLFQGADMFSCAIGAKLEPAHLPALTMVMRKVGIDARLVVDPPKDHYGRARPYTAPDAAKAPICVPKSDALARSPSYPSGHSTLSWSWGLILAELAPDRSSEVLARARSIGDSRVVCGVHYLSDIEAGRTAGASLIAALHGNAAFRADMDRARTELAALRDGPHAAPANCAVQDEAAAHPPY